MPTPRELAEAAGSGDTARMERILSQSPELGAHWQPLMNAALYGQAEAARLLLDAGADPNIVSATPDRFRPLHRAIEHRGQPRTPGHRAVVELLLERGSDPETRGCWQRMTALGTAGRAGEPELAELLRAAGAEVNVYTAAVSAWPDEVEARLREAPETTRVPDENGMTALHYAAASALGNSDEAAAMRLRSITELLLERGADPNGEVTVGPYQGLRVLHFASRENRGVVAALLAYGVDAGPCLGSFLWGEPNELAELLLAHGGDPNAWDGDLPLLHSRIHWGHAAAAVWLAEHGADANARDKQGRTALHVAAVRGNSLKIGEALLAAGAELGARDGSGKTPLDVAEEKGRTKFAAWLRERGAL